MIGRYQEYEQTTACPYLTLGRSFCARVHMITHAHPAHFALKCSASDTVIYVNFVLGEKGRTLQ